MRMRPRVGRPSGRNSALLRQPLRVRRVLSCERFEDRRLLAGDAVLDWNWIALEAVKNDTFFASPDQGGPTRDANALAVVHVAMFDAVNAVRGGHTPFEYSGLGVAGANLEAAVATAAYATLSALYPQQQSALDAAYADYLAEIPDGEAENLGIAVGNASAGACLASRVDDGADAEMGYEFTDAMGHHQVDPLHPLQGVLTPRWGFVKPFALASGDQFRVPAPPDLTSEEYAAAYNEVLVAGAVDAEVSDRDGNGLPDRTPEQSEIGLFWAYDGSKGLGTPPRFYNQIARVVAEQQGNTVEENARLFALLNVAQADAGIASWEAKYHYDFWRPVVAIRHGELDGNPDTAGDPHWSPLGAPASNSGDAAANFTPPFPAYVSGHATFGAAAFRILELFYGRNDIAFEVQSDELNGVTQGAEGTVRPAVTRQFNSFQEASWENALSRIYLGIHWRFDAEQGIAQGTAVADYVFENMLLEREVADDPVLDWNWIALDAVKNDHSLAQPDQGGPTRSANALAIVHAAIYDAVNAIEGSHAHYVYSTKGPASADLKAAVATAAHAALLAQFPQQKDVFDAAFASYLAAIPEGAEKTTGAAVGSKAAETMIAAREHDGTDLEMDHVLIPGPGHHQVDPLHPGQGFLTPKWGMITPFAMQVGAQFRVAPPPALDSEAYAAAYEEVRRLGAMDAETADRNGDGQPDRTPEQTAIGLFWAYDGTKGLGTPPRLYNQIARTIAIQQGNSVIENARLFALLNLAQADAGIASWEAKYTYDFWRPVVAIRHGAEDGNADTVGEEDWKPLGAPGSNSDDPEANFTPPFPAYVSGHATFGAAAFRILERFYGTDEIAFGVLSDELNGVTRGADGELRTPTYRVFERLSDAAKENALSRIYLGIHWSFDASEGIAQGTAVADYVFDHKLRLRPMFQNASNPMDVNNDGAVTITDIQAEVTQLRHWLAEGEMDLDFQGFCDIDGDGNLTLNDLLMVVGYVRDHGLDSLDAESESAAWSPNRGERENASLPTSAEPWPGLAIETVAAPDHDPEDEKNAADAPTAAASPNAVAAPHFLVPPEPSATFVQATKRVDEADGGSAEEALLAAILADAERGLDHSLSR